MRFRHVPAPPPPPGPPPLSTITMGKPLQQQQRHQQQSNDSDEESNQSGLASQLRQAKLKARGAGSGSGNIDVAAASAAAATVAQQADCSNNKNVAGNTATLGRAGGDSMMSEMQRVLAARKKAKEVVVKPAPSEVGIADWVFSARGMMMMCVCVCEAVCGGIDWLPLCYSCALAWRPCIPDRVINHTFCLSSRH